MIENIVSDVLSVVEKSINHSISNDEILSPVEIKRMQSRLISLCFSLLNAMKFNKRINFFTFNSVIEVLKCMRGIGLDNEYSVNTYDSLSEYSKALIDSLFDNFHKINLDQINIGELYERTFEYDLHTYESSIKYEKNKSSRDRAGAYYTPIEFANVSVQQAIDLFILNNLAINDFSQKKTINENHLEKVIDLLSKSNIIDFSCGSGYFLLAVINYVEKHIHSNDNEKKQLIRNVISHTWGIDIDYVALQIVKCELLSITGDLLCVNELNEHFILGNPLIQVDKEEVEEKKIDIFSLGIIYSKKLGLNLYKRFESVGNRFSLVVGNPPWEKIRLEEKKFFSTFAPEINSISQKKHREQKIGNLKEENPQLHDYYKLIVENLEEAKYYIKKNSKLKASLAGELNTYSVFTELALNCLEESGELCLILKSSIITSTNNSKLFRLLTSNGHIDRIYEFINSKKIFNIDSRERFCVMFLNNRNNKSFLVAMNLLNIEDIIKLENMSALTLDKISDINPSTNMLPNISSNSELEFLLALSRDFRKFEEVFPDCKFGRLVHFTNHSDYIHKEPENGTIAVYEGKFFEQYDNKYSTFEGVSYNDRYSNKASSVLISEEHKQSENHYPVARFFIEKDKWQQISKNYKEDFSLMWRSLTSSTNSRISVATILPHMPTSQSVQLLQHNNYDILVLLLSLFNSIIFDYLVKLKLNGIDLTQTIIKQIPTPEISVFEENLIFQGRMKTIKEHIFDRVFTLLSNDERLESLFLKLSYKPENIYGESFDKKKVMSEIDVLVSKGYKLELDFLKIIARQFPNFYSEDQIYMFFKQCTIG